MGYLDGFGVILKKWFGVQTDSGARVTLEYPEEVRPKPERFHGRHVLNRYEDGMEKCIGCELCAAVCPAKCIYVRGQDNDPQDPTSPGERFGYVYEINYLRCIHCDLCVEACPTEAITETKLFEFSFTNRQDAIYTKNELLVGDDGRPKQLPWENWDGGFDAARDTSGWMRATSPQGDHNFDGLIAWAGELGYGVRPPERGDVLDEVGPVPAVAPAHDPHGDHIARTPDEGSGADAVEESGDAVIPPADLFDPVAYDPDLKGTVAGDSSGALDYLDEVSSTVPTGDGMNVSGTQDTGGNADSSTVDVSPGDADHDIEEVDLSEAAQSDSDGTAPTPVTSDDVDHGDGTTIPGPIDSALTDATTDPTDTETDSETSVPTDSSDVEAAEFDSDDDIEADPDDHQGRDRHRAPGHFDADDVPEPEKKKGRFRR